MIENILANLKIERLNPMQEASIDAWKEGKRLNIIVSYGIRQDVSLSVAFGAEFEAWYKQAYRL